MAPAADATVRTTPPDDQRLIDALRAGDEAAFSELVSRYGASMLRVASSFVRSRAVAEEVVQETWLAVLNGLDRFEGRSSLRSWIFAILANRARTRAVREARSVPFSSLAGGDDGPTRRSRRCSSSRGAGPATGSARPSPGRCPRTSSWRARRARS